MRVRCEHCGLDVEAPPDSVGKKIRCPECAGVFVCRLPEAEVLAEDGQEQEQGEPGGELVLVDELTEPLPDDQAIELTEGLEVAEEPPVEPEVPAEAASPEEVLSDLGAAEPKRVVVENPRHWYIVVSGVAAVALTYDELKAKAAAGVVKPKTKVYYAPKDVTLRARDVPGLFGEEDKARRAQPAGPERHVSQAGGAAVEASEAAEALGSLGLGKEPAEAAPAAEKDSIEGESDELGDVADALSQLAPDEEVPEEDGRQQGGPCGR